MYRRLGVFSCSLLLVLTSLGCGSKPTAEQADSTEKQEAPGLIRSAHCQTGGVPFAEGLSTRPFVRKRTATHRPQRARIGTV